MSDLHLEFGDYTVPPLETDKETVLILAGDIGMAKKMDTYGPFIERCSEQFRQVIYIMGNHEYYKYRFPTAYVKIRDELNHYENVHILENQTILFQDWAFVCSTLWTDMNNSNPMSMLVCQDSLNDYRCIRTGPPKEDWKRKLTPRDTADAHLQSKKYVFEMVEFWKNEGFNICVVTHHLPSYQCIHEMYTGDPCNPAYASELYEDIVRTSPNIWIHGHTHSSNDFFIENTRVICNPRGYYPNDLNEDFNDLLLVQI